METKYTKCSGLDMINLGKNLSDLKSKYVIGYLQKLLIDLSPNSNANV